MGFTAHNVQLNFVNVPFVWSGEEKLEQFSNPTRVRERLATVPSWEHLHVCLSLQCAHLSVQTGGRLARCSAAVLQCCRGTPQTRLFTDTLQNLFPLMLKIQEKKKVLLWTLWFGNSELGWWCYGSSTFPGTTWTQAGRCVVSSVSVSV